MWVILYSPIDYLAPHKTNYDTSNIDCHTQKTLKYTGGSDINNGSDSARYKELFFRKAHKITTLTGSNLITYD